MLRRLAFIGSLIFVMGFTACARFPLAGLLYTDAQLPLTATAQLSMKSGEACAMHILGLIATGDASIETARKNGGIRSIASVDEKVTSFLFGAYATLCTIVHGK